MNNSKDKADQPAQELASPPQDTLHNFNNSNNSTSLRPMISLINTRQQARAPHAVQEPSSLLSSLQPHLHQPSSLTQLLYHPTQVQSQATQVHNHATRQDTGLQNIMSTAALLAALSHTQDYLQTESALASIANATSTVPRQSIASSIGQNQLPRAQALLPLASQNANQQQQQALLSLQNILNQVPATSS